MEKQKKVTEVIDIKTVEENTEVKIEEPTTTDPKPDKEEENIVKKDNVFKKIGKKIKTNYNETKHKMHVNKQIKLEFKKDASCYTVLDTVVKSTVKLLLQKEEDIKTFIYLGNLKLKHNTILKNKEGALFKIIAKIEGEHTKEFVVGDEHFTRELTKYSYVEI